MAKGKKRELSFKYLDGKLINLVLKLMASESPGEFQSIVEKNPVLLTKKTFDIIDLLIESAYGGEEEAIEPLLETRTILTMYKEFGIEKLGNVIKTYDYEPPKQIRKNLQAIEKLRQQLERREDSRVISKAIRLMDKVLTDPQFPSTPPHFQFETLFDAANLGIQAGMLLRDLDLLDKALEHVARASNLAPDHPMSAELKLITGQIHTIKFTLTNEPDFADEAIRIYKGAIDALLDESESKAHVLASLALLILQRVGLTDDPSQIDESIGYLKKAVSLSRKLEDSDEITELFLNNHQVLGNAYLTRAKFSQKVKDINDAIKWYKTGLQEAEKNTGFVAIKHPFLKGLSKAYFERYQYTHLAKDLLEANQYITLYLSLMPEDDFDRNDTEDLAREILEAIKERGLDNDAQA
jgi:tetratricopeptide (TPR) repeat protein